MESWKKLTEKRKAAEDLLHSTETKKWQLNYICHDVFFSQIRWRRTGNERLMNLALRMCRDEAVKQWMTQQFHYGAFHKLADMFNFLKSRIDEEEKKGHGDHVDITFSAHGAIRDSMIPAKCLLPLSTVEDVVLYSPWNCLILADAVYAVAAGIMKPQDRVFKCHAKDGCKIPGEGHQPKNLPNHWNSIKEAGDKLVPNITLSPKKPEERDLEKYNSLIRKQRISERNRIFIPYIPPAEDKSSESVPFYVVSLALSLVLLGRKFKATLHLPTCLGDQSTGSKLDKEYLENQYACTIDKTLMTVNPDIYNSGFPFFQVKNFFM